MLCCFDGGFYWCRSLFRYAARQDRCDDGKRDGGTLGFLAIVVALGAMFGKILHETGAVDQIAVKMLKSFGHSRAHYAIGLAGLICALPLFFEVAVVLLISVAFSMARHTGTNLVKLVIPLFAGVAAAAAFLLPDRHRCCWLPRCTPILAG
ncbi:low affinity gluconate transporter [Enterobacter cloacae]|uniref:Low affinity gluconate transporter n=1 Tax=Enterobacter cloacae TaxID=550 RepID=A0A377LST3_ENTCL|nr:low affinity gluconate transporter [Enterobacter cloacae]